MDRFSTCRLPGSHLVTLLLRTGTLLFLALYVGWGCGSDSPTGSNKKPPTNTSRIVTIQSGNQQTAKIGEAVPIPPSVRVASSSGTPVAGAAVAFVVASGGGSLQGANQTTRADGVASVGAWILGDPGVNTLSATVSGATSGSPALFSATAEEVIVTIQAGDEQSGKAGEPVPVPPSVRVATSNGVPVPGTGVAFAVASGGGSLQGADTTTDADGVASVGAWILGEVGADTLTVTVEDATTGSPALFSATAEEQVIAPTADTTLSGTVTATRLVVPAGVTVTVIENLVLKTDSAIDVQGTIVGECVPVQLETDGALLIGGTINNSCLAGEPSTDLNLIGLNGFDVEEATIQSSGDVWLTNDPTLMDTDFPAPVAGAPAAVNGAMDSGLGDSKAPAAAKQAASVGCRVISTNLRPYPLKARKGTDRTGTGLPGADGRRWQIDCRGELRVQGGVSYQGQHGGDGGAGTHTPAVIDAYAEGGAGGRGGYMIVRATQRVSFDGILNEIISGEGGHGGDATATSSPSGNGVAGPKADAFGGPGGEPGLFSILAPVIDFAEVLDLVIGSAGDGGNAVASSGAGLDAQGSSRAQAGGPAYAEGGAGAGTPDLTLAARNGVEITGTDNARVSGGNAGAGGTAEAVGGTGGAGSGFRPDGGTGGMSEARGGNGGTALLRDHRMELFGVGGDGGDALLSGALGGLGRSRCGLPDGFQPGGLGGSGGDLTGGHGQPGSGASSGTPGLIRLNGAGNGGDGGNGEPKANGGSGGTQSMSKPPLTIGNNTVGGSNGFECVRPTVGLMKSTVNGSENLDPGQPCEMEWSPFDLVNHSPHPVDYSIAISDLPTFRVAPLTGVIPAAPGATKPWNTTPLKTFRDICSMVAFGPDVFGEIAVTFTLGSTSVTKAFPVEFRFR